MSKKTIGLTLSAVVVALGIGAQFYTNHKVDQVLANFPYSLDTQLSLQVAQTGKNFLSRELTFSLQNSDKQSTDIITTKLTTLPFFITAESRLSEQLTRQLNKNLNINLDKTVINSKFSPVGDYLQSDVSAEFRDFANKSQNLLMTLHLLKTQEVKLSTSLSGFNYDNNSKLEKIDGRLRLIPTARNQYDLAEVELTAEKAEADLLNGENTKIQLKNATYKFAVNHTANGQKRDLNTQFSSDILRLSNKNRTNEENQTTIGGLNLSLRQEGVPNSLNFYNEFKKLDPNHQNAKELINLLTAIFTQNEHFDGKLSVLSVNVPKNNQPYFNLTNATLSLNQNNTDLNHADIDLTLNAESVKQTPADTNKQWQANNFALSYQLKDLNLTNELAFMPYYLALFNQTEPPAKDNSEFLRLKDNWVKGAATSGEGNLNVQLGAFDYAELKLEKVQFSEKYASLDNDQYDETLSLNAAKVSLPKYAVQLEYLKFNLPLKINHHQNFAAAQFCNNGLYSVLCGTQLSSATLQKYQNNQWKDLDMIADNVALTFNLNTYPETQAYPVALDLDAIISPAEDDKNSPLGNVEATAHLNLAKGLIDETNEAVLKIKNDTPFWQYLRLSIKPQGRLAPEFVEEGEKYQLTFEKNENGYLINGKSSEDLRQEREMLPNENADESEPMEAEPAEAEPAAESQPAEVKPETTPETAPPEKTTP